MSEVVMSYELLRKILIFKYTKTKLKRLVFRLGKSRLEMRVNTDRSQRLFSLIQENIQNHIQTKTVFEFIHIVEVGKSNALYPQYYNIII